MKYELKETDYLDNKELERTIGFEALWEIYLGFLPSPGEKFLSPIREERDPSANLFAAHDGTILFKDFGGKTLNIWQFIQKKFNLSFQGAVEKVYKEYKSGKFDSVVEPNGEYKIKELTKLPIKTRPFRFDDLKFWDQYGIGEGTLIYFNVKAISHFWYHGEKLVYCPTFSYSYEYGNSLRKIYRPYDEQKFVTNIRGEVYAGWDQLPTKGAIVVITKSHKDVMSWFELGIPAISPQSETSKISLSTIKKLKERFTNVILNFDNDKTGKERTVILCALHDIKSFFIPDCKDISDYIKKYGIQKALQLKNKLLYERET